jgi:hypothetical protein
MKTEIVKMPGDQDPARYSHFQIDGKRQEIKIAEDIEVREGVTCWTYNFLKDDGTVDKTKDLGIVRVKGGYKTPLQKVLKGDRTVEGFVSGKGSLRITRESGKVDTYKVGENPYEVFSQEVEIGEIMQWEADGNSELVFYEVCYPPYEDGRYENLD